MFINNFIVIVLVILFIVNEYKKNRELNKRLDKITKENFTSPQSTIDAVSVSNLANLAQNIISNNGENLNLEYKNIVLNTGENGSVSINAFEHMIVPFYIDFTQSKQIDKLKNRFWFLCDGQKAPNGETLPDLRGRFIWGGGPNDNKGDITNDTTKVINEGGEITHGLTIGEMPEHTHKVTVYHSNFAHKGSATEGSTKNDGDGTFDLTSKPTGGGQPHNNMPPYMVMAYFIYLP